MMAGATIEIILNTYGLPFASNTNTNVMTHRYSA